MKLPELIENLHLDLNQLDRNVINNEIIANYSDHDLAGLVDIFLRGIGSQHNVNGNVVYNLRDITRDLIEYKQFTRKQQIYIIQNILENWNQIGVEARASLNL